MWNVVGIEQAMSLVLSLQLIGTELAVWALGQTQCIPGGLSEKAPLGAEALKRLQT